ncbi:MAG: hypothetical protein ACRCZY_07620 [Phocaeicola sp.]
MIEVWFIFALALLINMILGYYRLRYKKFSFMWFFMIHASLFILLPIRIYLMIPTDYALWIIATAILGQSIGSRFLGKRS